MKYEELLYKYQAMCVENEKLKNEIEDLKRKLSSVQDSADGITLENSVHGTNNTTKSKHSSVVDNLSAPEEKVKLFMSLFRGREDVYAKRWENRKKGTTGYSPVCLNEWKQGLCNKPKTSCYSCKNKDYAALDETIVADHLRGHKNFVVGVYPLSLNETCHFLAIDLDGEDWQKDMMALHDVCAKFCIPIAVERSRSGNGGHAWFFFADEIPAALARKLGSSLLTHAMTKRHEIKFKSYDRLFPNQDTMPKGGLGNLIALPLQKAARNNGNSVFIDESGRPYEDQWAYLSSIERINENEVEQFIVNLCPGNELGELRSDEDNPWEMKVRQLINSDFPDHIDIVKADMLYVSKNGITQQALNYLKRFAAFKNPEFYRAQAMRLPVKKIPRIISCSEETEEYLCLPRGCETDLCELSRELDLNISYVDKTNHGKKIEVEFNGKLRDEQPLAVNKLLEHNNGVLCGTTAFGKTVAAINLIAERKVNTLIIVDKVNLVSQWKKRISEFLTIKEELPEIDKGKKRGRKKSRSIIGQLGGGKNNLSRIIDIAVMQSLNRMGEIKDCVKNYGLVIVDECHHVSAFSFEQILKNVNAKYVYGLTATPTRKDGHHPIIFMQCGPIRYRDDAKKQAEKRPFEHYIIPRFSSMRIPLNKNEKEVMIQDCYSEIINNEIRNQQIVEDVIKCYENGRNCLVLTQRTAHVELLAKKLGERIPNVITLMGGMGTKVTRETLQKISDTPRDKQLTLVATGKYIGEGFDEPRLDTLFLAMPVSWKGTLQQYAGRLHRLFENKDEVQIYDYVDINIRMLERMYQKRLSGYAAIGYKVKGESTAAESIDIIFNKNTFSSVYSNDIINSAREILIVSPFVTRKRSLQMLPNLKTAIQKGVKVIIVTRPASDFKNRALQTIRSTLDLFSESGVSVVQKPNIHQKFAIIDQQIVWYGSINLLSYGSAEESIMRLESHNIANELIKTIMES